MFVRNCWYVIAWDHEVPQDGLFSRTVLGEVPTTLTTQLRRPAAGKPKRQPISQHVVVSLWANGSIRMAASLTRAPAPATSSANSLCSGG